MSHHENVGTDGPQAISEGGETPGPPGGSFHFKDEISGLKGSRPLDVAELNQAPATIAHHESVAATHAPPAISGTAELPLLEQRLDDHFNIDPGHAPSALVTQVAHDLMV
jgi:hypothetical protein